MAPGSPTASNVQNLVFWSRDDTLEDDVEDGLGEVVLSPNVKTEGDESQKRESMYVQLFEEMLRIVLRDEAHLFTDAEIDCFTTYNSLNYSSRFLFIRLLLRKPAKWHAMNTFNYRSELGDNIHEVIKDLCNVQSSPAAEVKKEELPEIIDLTSDAYDHVDLTSDDPGQSTSVADASQPQPGEFYSDEDLQTFAEDDSQASLRELLECLTVVQLKTLARQMKVNANGKRGALIDALIATSSCQTTLKFCSKGKGKSDNLCQTLLPSPWSSKGKTQTERLRCMVLNILGPCIRVNTSITQLFRRVNLIYLRSTQSAPSILTESILVKSKKRAYNPVKYKRTPDIWPSRDALLAYEEALLLEAQVDELLGAAPSSSSRERTVVSATPAQTQTQTRSVSLMSQSQWKGSSVSLDVEGLKESPRVQAARQVKLILERVHPQWKALVVTKAEDERRPNGLERFDCGHVLTRIIYKGAHALGLLHEHKAELEILEELLKQRRWRRGKRGQWYERRALILTTHLKDETRAMTAVIEALEDADTHLVYRPKLARRLSALEKKLKMPFEDRHSCEGQLKKCEEVSITGVRVRHNAASLVLDQNGRLINKATGVRKEEDGMTQQTLPFLKNENKPTVASKSEKWVGKSIWFGRDNEEVTVEVLALQHYEKLGYRGYHSEGSVVRMLFGLLFWDVIFAPIPGAFETPYQSAPLDIAEDSFFFAREDLIAARIEQIEQGEAPVLIESIDDEHRPSGTWCVGVRWDMFPKEDLSEIANYLGGKSLSTICQLLCEDYAARASGVPDLIVWNAESQDCRFVEVKGPDDKLSENQKLWIDVLLRAGTVVEVCHVEEQGRSEGKNKTKTRTRKKRKAKEVPETEESDAPPLDLESEEEDGMNFSQIDSSPSKGVKRVLEDVSGRKPLGRRNKLLKRTAEDFVSASQRM